MTRGSHSLAIGTPAWLMVPALLGVSFVVLPLVAMAIRIDWVHFGALISSPAAVDAPTWESSVAPTRSGPATIPTRRLVC